MLKGRKRDGAEAYDGIRTYPCGSKSTCTAVFKSGHSEFIIVSKIDERSKDNLYIHRYSSKEYRYSKLQGGRGDVYPPSHLSISDCVCGYDSVSKDLYIAGDQCDVYYTRDYTGRVQCYLWSVLKSLNVENGKQTDFEVSGNHYEQRTFSVKCMILIGGNIHMFGCYETRTRQGFTVSSEQQHRIFNIVSLKFVESNDLTSHSTWIPQHALFNKSRNSIIAILCKNSLSQNRNLPRNSSLVEYSLDTQQHRCFDWSQTNGTLNPSMVNTLDGRYIVVFGKLGTQQITVFDLLSCSVSVSGIQCPSNGLYRAVLLGGNERDELAIFGFVRKVYESVELKDVQEIPIHILQLMSKWYCNEIVHLIAAKGGRHWRIDIDKIISSNQKC